MCKVKLYASLYLYLLIAIFFCSCNNEHKSNSKNKEENDKVSNDNYDKLNAFKLRDNNSNTFLFLDFWSGMNLDDFKVIADSLVMEGILELKDSNLMFNLYIEKESNFSKKDGEMILINEPFKVTPLIDDTIVGINLYFDNGAELGEKFNPINSPSEEEIIEVYNKKYGLPKVEKHDDNWYHYNKQVYTWYSNDVTIILEKAISTVNTDNEIPILSISYYNDRYYKSKKQKELDEERRKRLKKDSLLNQTLESI